MKKSRSIIRVIGDVDEALFLGFTQELHEAEEAGHKVVTVELCSGGGLAYDALAFYSRIRMSPCEVHVHATGLVSSAAVLILAAGDSRSMSKEAWVMVHEDSCHKLSAKVTEGEKYFRHLRKLEDQWNRLLADKTKLSAEGWCQLHKAESYLTPGDCLKYGLVEEVL